MLSKANRISSGDKQDTLKCTLSDPGSQSKIKGWRGRAAELSAGKRVQLTNSTHCPLSGGNIRNLRMIPREIP